MEVVTCRTCGVQHEAPSGAPPDRCAICEDERQYVGWDGQQWTTLEELRRNHRPEIREEERGLTGIGMSPSLAIGQRALLVRTPGGNILWDCIPLLDGAIEEEVARLGGIAAIAISHPHFYSSMVEWGRAFGAPVLVHADDREWIMRRDPCLQLWEGDSLELHDGISLVRCGGHFDGAAVLHWPAGADGRGAVLAGDTIMVCQDRRHVSFMRSYPNLIPLGPPAVHRILASLRPYRFDRIWSGWWSKRVASGARESLQVSASRHLRAIGAGQQ